MAADGAWQLNTFLAAYHALLAPPAFILQDADFTLTAQAQESKLPTPPNHALHDVETLQGDSGWELLEC